MIDHLDHIVLTTTDGTACIDFYTRVLGMTLEPPGLDPTVGAAARRTWTSRTRPGVLRPAR